MCIAPAPHTPQGPVPCKYRTAPSPGKRHLSRSRTLPPRKRAAATPTRRAVQQHDATSSHIKYTYLHVFTTGGATTTAPATAAKNSTTWGAATQQQHQCLQPPAGYALWPTHHQRTAEKYLQHRSPQPRRRPPCPPAPPAREKNSVQAPPHCPPPPPETRAYIVPKLVIRCPLLLVTQNLRNEN